MSQYVDGYLIAIKKKNIQKYKRMATMGRDVWMSHGALLYFECIGEDLKTSPGKTFIQLCKLKPNETAIFAFVVYKSKSHRNQVNKKVMSDPRMDPAQFKEMPIEMKNMSMK